MKEAYKLLDEFRQLAPTQQDECIQWLTGAFDCVASGFNPPHRDSEKAQWAIKEFADAIQYAKNVSVRRK